MENNFDDLLIDAPIFKDNKKFEYKVNDQQINSFYDELKKDLKQSIVDQFNLSAYVKTLHEGASIDTIHNVREGTWIDSDKKNEYENRKNYDKKIMQDIHGNDPKYRQTNQKLRNLATEGKIKDAYTGRSFSKRDLHRKNLDLDHVISTQELYDDPGRILAGVPISEVANADSNLKLVNKNINRSKSNRTMKEFIVSSKNGQEKLRKNKADILNDSSLSSEQKNAKIQKLDNRIDPDYENMNKIDQKAREEYNKKINKQYYFSKDTIKNATGTSVKMGLSAAKSQVIGIVLMDSMEIIIPRIETYIKNWGKMENMSARIENFGNVAEDIIIEIKKSIKKIKKDVFESGKEAFKNGVISNLVTIIINAFVKTLSSFGKLLVDAFKGCLSAIKLLITNPQHLNKHDLMIAVIKLIGATAIGTLGFTLTQAVSISLKETMLAPISTVIGNIVGALFTGILTALFMTVVSNFGNIVRQISEDWDDIKFGLTYSAKTISNSYYAIIAKIDDSYIEILSEIELEYEKYSNLRELSFDFHSLGEVQFKNSQNFAEINGVKNVEILKTKDDIDKFFNN